MTDKIDQSDSALKINRSQSGQAKWDADALPIETKLKFQDNDVQINDRWTLGGDRKTILIARHLKSAQGETDQKLVMVKQ